LNLGPVDIVASDLDNTTHKALNEDVTLISVQKKKKKEKKRHKSVERYASLCGWVIVK